MATKIDECRSEASRALPAVAQGHTPGPWVVDTIAGYFTALGVGPQDGHAIAILTRDASGGAEQQQANARLIAAAPDLLDALKNLMNGIETGAITSDHDETFANAAQRARAALAKAQTHETE